MQLTIPDMPTGYRAVLSCVENGNKVTVRGEPTRELLDMTLVLENPYSALPVGVGRKLNLQIAALEALQLIGGVSHPHLLVKAAANFANFQDGGIFHGAYGPRVRAQLSVAVERLKVDPQTRQAVVVIWDPLHDLMVPDSRDYPCTVMLQFLIRNGELQLHTTMRSNDVWLGLAYDAFQFTQLQITVANVLDIPAGAYYHHAVSMHLYERDLEAAAKITKADDDDPPQGATGVHADTMHGAMDTARRLLTGEKVNGFGHGWYEQALKKLLAA